MLSSSPRDNWERLVAAVLKKDEIWQLCHQDSITTVSSDSHRPSNSNSSGEILRSSSRSSRISLSSPRQTLLTGAEATKNTFGIQKIFSALLGRRKPKGYDLGQGLAGLPEDNFGLQSFSLRELHAATDNFSNTNVLRNEGHSSVYKGRLADGSLVAVKRFTRKLKEMEKELEIASIAAHHNVIRALGFCITEKEWLLVYAYTYMVNGSVAYCLRERQEPLPPLDWPARKWIAVGAAKGLAYLHYNCPRKIIHRDVKAANILLDEDLEAVVCNFNLAEFVDCYEDDGVRGTIGHIAPEYLATGKCSVKNDVFGYGVFLLELITAQKSFDLARVANDNNDMMLLNLVKESCKERKWKEVVDAELRSDLVAEEVETLLQIALICTQTDPEGRPTMVEVVRMLRVGYGCAGRWEKWDEEGFDVENLEFGNLRRFTIHELQVATKDFSIKVISKDGFNMIYKGWLDGSPVAVKRYISQSLEYYFEKELDIGKLCLHPNIVQVIGCCKTPEEQLLVFRFMVNGSVESWLKGRDESRPSLTWQKRRKIALGAARGLAFLHDKPGKKIINRDVKASNILLDDNFEAVVADFKLAKLIKYNTSHVTTIVTGTIGHIAPEYLASGKCSDKTDVFGYGAFLLELVTGQRIIDFLEVVDEKDMFCADWVKRNYKKRRWELVADKDSEDDFMEAVVKKLVQISVLCTQYDPDKRPRMSDVVRMLEVGDVLAERSEERSKKEVGEEGGPLKNYLDAEPIEDDDSLACNPDDHFGFASYSLCELHDATDGFSKKNVIGHGGHSTVYKGRLGDGSLVAVKRLRQQVIGIELEIANHLAHCNVVLLCGFCITQTEQLLVYPYMANGSVASCLRERPETQPPLNLAVRQKIALGVAKGLAYLHHECNRVIIHRDIKAANILLDEDFEAVVADFTLAKFTDCYDDDIVTAVRGTIGHIAPEYLSTSKLSVKSDVFSYGVFLLELVTGNRAVDLARLANQDGMWVKKLCKEKRIEVMVDLDLRGNFEVKEVEKLLQIALICRQSDPKERPSMLEVVRMLEYEDIFNLDSRWERLLNNESEPSSSEWTITVTDNLSFTAAEELSGPR